MFKQVLDLIVVKGEKNNANEILPALSVMQPFYLAFQHM